MKNKTITIGLTVLVLLTLVAAQTFSSDQQAQAYKNASNKKPVQPLNVTIIEIESELNSTEFGVLWMTTVTNPNNNETETLIGTVWMDKTSLNNNKAIQNSVKEHAKKVFSQYEERITPNPHVEYVNHTLWGSVVNI